jgi:F-type H+-transporting ATPase subunit c
MTNSALAFLSAGFGAGLAVLGAGLGIGRLAAAGLDGVTLFAIVVCVLLAIKA